jgi:phosphohistidine phosphatase SixA
MKSRYILLLRHGAVDRSSDEQDRDHPLKNGGQDIRDVANSLGEHLRLLPENKQIRIGEIWFGSYKHVLQSAGIIIKILETQYDVYFQPTRISECNALNPDEFWISLSKEERQKVGRWLINNSREENYFGRNYVKSDSRKLAKDNNAILLVGHSPQMGWIAEYILRKPFSISRGELVCIEISYGKLDRLLMRDRWVKWTIWSPPKEEKQELRKDLREKIDSKMKLAGILGGLIIGILTFLLKSLLDKEFLTNLDILGQWIFFVAAIFFFLALGLYLGTIYAYDRLMMPTRFWSERARIKEQKWLVQRPPGSDLWILYQNMVRIWYRLFTPATWAVVFGLLILAYDAFRPNLVVALILVPVLGLFWLYLWSSRPSLGTDD